MARVSLLVTIFVLASLLASCGGGGGTESGSSTTSQCDPYCYGAPNCGCTQQELDDYFGDSSIGNSITKRDVERHCEAWMWGSSVGDVECSLSRLDAVEDHCDVYSVNKIKCRVSSLKFLERCTVKMYSQSYGNIDCEYADERSG